ncbi:MAG: hypothetical protein ABSD62_09560 [Candidatus Limnocylindrales bacterium]|jgi:hypothetical protein
MIAFLVELENRVGSVAEVAEAIAERGINITGGAGVACGGSGQLAFTTNDEAGTRRLLLSRGYKFREIELVPITLADTPGTFARTCRALAEAKINIEAAFAMGASGDRTTMAFATDDPARARTILSQKALSGTGR